MTHRPTCFDAQKGVRIETDAEKGVGIVAPYLGCGLKCAGPDGKRWTVVRVDTDPDELQWVTATIEAGGSVQFPRRDAAKWLRPVCSSSDESQHRPEQGVDRNTQEQHAMVNQTEFNQDLSSIHVNGSHSQQSQFEREPVQRDVILEHLKVHGSITKAEAEEKHGCPSVAAVICCLRREGWKIDTDYEKQASGRAKAVYRLIGNEAGEDGQDTVDQKVDQPVETTEEPTQAPLADEPARPVDDVPEAPEVPENEQNADADDGTGPYPVATLAVVLHHGRPVLVIDDQPYRLTQQQMRYLAVTMTLCGDMDE